MKLFEAQIRPAGRTAPFLKLLFIIFSKLNFRCMLLLLKDPDNNVSQSALNWKKKKTNFFFSFFLTFLFFFFFNFFN